MFAVIDEGSSCMNALVLTPIPPGMYVLDEAGNQVLDENGDPILAENP